MQQTRVQQWGFMFRSMYHIVMLMSYAYINNKQHVLCITLI